MVKPDYDPLTHYLKATHPDFNRIYLRRGGLKIWVSVSMDMNTFSSVTCVVYTSYKLLEVQQGKSLDWTLVCGYEYLLCHSFKNISNVHVFIGGNRHICIFGGIAE